MNDEADRTGGTRSRRAIWTLRARYWLMVVLDGTFHRVARSKSHVDGSGRWPCFETDDVFLERLIYDERWAEHRHLDWMTN